MFDVFVQLLLADKGFHFCRQMADEVGERRHVHVLFLCASGDRPGHRGERDELQESGTSQEHNGLHLQLLQ